MAKNKYSSTVLLPKTDFPMRAGLAQKEPKILDFWKQINLYQAILKKTKRENTLYCTTGRRMPTAPFTSATLWTKPLRILF